MHLLRIHRTCLSHHHLHCSSRCLESNLQRNCLQGSSYSLPFLQSSTQHHLSPPKPDPSTRSLLPWRPIHSPGLILARDTHGRHKPLFQGSPGSPLKGPALSEQPDHSRSTSAPAGAFDHEPSRRQLISGCCSSSLGKKCSRGGMNKTRTRTSLDGIPGAVTESHLFTAFSIRCFPFYVWMNSTQMCFWGAAAAATRRRTSNQQPQK